MIKKQNIVFTNALDYGVAHGGIIDEGTEILNLFFEDNCDSNTMCLIGDQMEWKPEVWMDFEHEKINNLKELNIVCLHGDLTDFSKHCKEKYPNTTVNYHTYNLWLQGPQIRRSLSYLKQPHVAGKKTNAVHYSAGTIRLNRYVLVKESIKQNYNFYYPTITLGESKDFEYQISQCARTPMEETTEIPGRRMFEKQMSQEEFNTKQLEVLSNSYICPVAPSPNHKWYRDMVCEKFFDVVLSKTVPLMFCEKGSNKSGVDLLGFLPYVGFNLDNDSNINHVLRWQSLLQDNRHILKDIDKCRELFEMNSKIVDYNHDRLVKTNWIDEEMSQYKKLPDFIKTEFEMIKKEIPQTRWGNF
jgi:hypothetical protein